jgi:hypothetical protein
MWKTPLLTKAFDAGAAIGAYRIVKFGADDDTVILGAVGTDALIGITGQVGAAAGDRVDVDMAGIGEVAAGDSITRGNQLTTDADGAAVVASAGDTVIGVALKSAVSGDVIPVLLHAAGDSDAVPLLYADLVVTSAQLLALYTTPLSIVAAPGTGKVVVPVMAQAFHDAGTAYDGVDAGEDLVLRYTDASGAIALTIETDGFLNVATDQHRLVHGPAVAFAPVANAALVLHMTEGNIATGTGTLDVRVWYRVVPIQS